MDIQPVKGLDADLKEFQSQGIFFVVSILSDIARRYQGIEKSVNSALISFHSFCKFGNTHLILFGEGFKKFQCFQNGQDRISIFRHSIFYIDVFIFVYGKKKMNKTLF